jgi:hypothetical protein
MKFYGDYQIYSESGVDLTMLRENLRRTIDERVANNARGLRMLQALRKSGRTPSSSGSARSEMVAVDDLGASTVFRLLVAQQVKFVLVGESARAAHGVSSITDKICLCYSQSRGNLFALAAALAPVHPQLRSGPSGLLFRLNVPTIQLGLNFTLTTDAGEIDLLAEVPGIGGYEQAVGQSEERLIFGLAIPVLSLDGLIVATTASGRSIDQLHLLELEELKKLRDAQP